MLYAFFLFKFKAMKIRKELIGSKVFHKILNKYILIELGKEDFYDKLGMDVFERLPQPKLKRNDKNRKRRNDNLRSNSDGTNNDK